MFLKFDPMFLTLNKDNEREYPSLHGYGVVRHLSKRLGDVLRTITTNDCFE